MKSIASIINDRVIGFEIRDETSDSRLTTPDQVFIDFRTREKSLVYDDYYYGFVHAVQILGRSSNGTEGWVMCMGGQGHTTQKRPGIRAAGRITRRQVEGRALGKWTLGRLVLALSNWAAEPRVLGIVQERAWMSCEMWMLDE